jgi:quinone-modifying oxidoreductase subunit QmoC
MADVLRIEPDREFIEDVTRAGGGNVKKCFQCATCSSVCELSTDARPFPRQQILEAQWGMTDQLMGDPAVWLCHSCGDCSVRCPRQGRPGDIMGGIRAAVIKRLAFPRFMGGAVARPATAALILAFSALLLVAVMAAPLHGQLTAPLVFGEMFPKSRLEPMFFVVSGFVLLALAVGAARFAKALRSAGANGAILPALFPVLIEVVTHRRFADCRSEAYRRWGHMLALGAFLGLAVMGTIVGIGSMVGTIDTPLPVLHPLKIFANLCALVLAAGVLVLVWERLYRSDDEPSGAFFDWFFLSLLLGIAVTGILSEALRVVQNQIWMYVIYFVHLTLVLALFLSTPYSKFAHFLYRTMALAATWEEHKLSSRAVAGASSPAIAPEDSPGLHPASS